MKRASHRSAGTPRIVLADEQPMLCEMAARILQPEFEVVSRVHDGPSAVAAARLQPDAVVLDLMLPLLGGADVVSEIVRVSPSTRVVVLTMNDDASIARSALDAGASAYLLKTAALEELPAAIREVLRGHTYVTEALTARLTAQQEKPAPASLTRREHQVLALLVAGKPMREAGRILNLTPRTIAFHKYRIMKKLQVSTSAELIRMAIVRSLAR